MAQHIPIPVGSRFGNWTVERHSLGEVSGRQRHRCHCVCDCGAEGIVLPSALRLGQSTRCRVCSNRAQAAKKARLTHGDTSTRLYRIWCQMRRRCDNPDHEDFSRYGGRGIEVCSEWSDFAVFRAWAEANGYSADLTIDRENNDRGYNPANCRWISRVDQNRNRENNQRYAWRGRHLMLSEIAEISGLSHDLIRQRVRRDGWDIERAASTPARPVRPYQRKRK
ncbi:hypothetical protein [Sphingobium lactosutens]|jgi:hypothetical protein|uniref:hypothetical protein n=1 Tax=Sphingobium lactosutens TaxID=522773 RepID=UPI001D18BF16|nr:hypothetical protein [Sphingobium lactosutens]MCC4258045.1 hypothetical protein [Sphingobium lactosutens]